MMFAWVLVKILGAVLLVKNPYPRITITNMATFRSDERVQTFEYEGLSGEVKFSPLVQAIIFDLEPNTEICCAINGLNFYYCSTSEQPATPYPTTWGFRVDPNPRILECEIDGTVTQMKVTIP